MEIIIDNKIPCIKEAVQRITDEIAYVLGEDFALELVRDVDALIVRTRTHCNQDLLEDSRMKFMAAATIGFDHVDTGYCKRAGIERTNVLGCSSISAAQYIQSPLLAWGSIGNKGLNKLMIGVIGAGDVGSKVAKVAQDFGMRVLLNDLPREEKEDAKRSSSLEKIVEECDIITFHVPSYKEGGYKTFHLTDEVFFQLLRQKSVIISTSRGEVIQTDALLKALNNRMTSDAIVDVWGYKPEINHDLLEKTFIGTPHIAGYSADEKANVTRTSLDAICNSF